MKKLMIAAAIVCAAAFAQAATFTWSSANLMGPDVDLANLSAGHVSAGSTAIKNMSISWSYEISLSNDSGQSATLPGSSWAWKGSKANITGLESDVMWKPSSNLDPDNVVDYSIVITGTYTDTKETVWTFTSDAITGQNSYSSLSDLVLATGGVSGWTISGGDTPTPPPTPTPTPEPTSGLLLLLGVAGLALRRRRA